MTRRTAIVVALYGGVTSVAALLLLSPLLIGLVGDQFDVDWARLSEIGQSYTGISALLSALALVGVAASIRLQTKQTSITLQHSVRDLQFGLLRLAMDDPLYASVLQPMPTEGPSTEHNDYRRFVYITQWFRLNEFSFESGELTRRELNSILRTEMFPRPEIRQWWDRARPFWQDHAAEYNSKRYTEFLAMVESAYQDSSPDPEDPAP
jgi:hypothetical protein